LVRRADSASPRYYTDPLGTINGGCQFWCQLEARILADSCVALLNIISCILYIIHDLMYLFNNMQMVSFGIKSAMLYQLSYRPLL
jgi:hypothetical protein